MTPVSSASSAARATEPAGTPPAAGGYEEDFALWSAEQARLIRAGALGALDLENLAEEVESMGTSQRSSILNRLAVVLEHLLKWEFQPEKRKYGWRATLNEQRASIEGLVDVSPSLKGYPAAVLAKAYRIARPRAALDTDLPERVFPLDCPYTIEQALNGRFYPGPEERDVV